jgi:hypothetical protein
MESNNIRIWTDDFGFPDGKVVQMPKVSEPRPMFSESRGRLELRSNNFSSPFLKFLS